MLRILRDSKDPRSQYLHQATLEKETSSSSNRFAPALALTSIEALQDEDPPPARHTGLGFEQQQTRCFKTTAYKYFANLDNQEQIAHLRSLQMQGKWSTFDDIMKGDWSWNKLLYNCTDSYLQFLVNAPNNSLPTPDNLHRWSREQVSPCCQVGNCSHQRPTLQHILCCCYASLQQGRYTWRHNEVLAGIAHSLQAYSEREMSNWGNNNASENPFIEFVPESDTPKPVRIRRSNQRRQQFIPFSDTSPKQALPPARRPLASEGILHTANDWQFAVDLDSFSQHTIPESILVTSQRPDIVIYSVSTKRIVLIELTVPWEDNITAAAARKVSRYAQQQKDKHTGRTSPSLVENLVAAGWQTDLFTIEIGCRGYCGASLRNCLKALGMGKQEANNIRKKAGDTAKRCSYIIYCKRNTRDWSQPSSGQTLKH
jgi:hypothetical protein